MKTLDKHYLSLQFKLKIYSKYGNEFQSFFEDIMEKLYPNFRKVPPARGDGGNDGWIKELGRYYQVYAPNTPQTKDSEAANKLKTDFLKLIENWDNIKEIKEYYFVFNDHYCGSKEPESKIVELEEEYPKIKFKLLLAINLEREFFELKEVDMLYLGFNIDSRDAIRITREFLQNIEIELDRENVISAAKLLENSKDIITQLADEGLFLEYDILESRCLQKQEKVEEAKEKYNNISIRFPEDPRAFLYLAEIYLMEGDYGKNIELLEKAESIDSDHWLLKLETMVRKIHLGENINGKFINLNMLPNDLRIKSNFYRLFALFIENTGDKDKIDSYIENAITLNPDRFINYFAKLSVLGRRIFSNQNSSQILYELQGLLKEIEKVENRFSMFGDIGARNKASLNLIKLDALRIQEKISDFEKLSQETFKLIISCYFDKQIDSMFVSFLRFIIIPANDLEQLLIFLENSKKQISDELSKVLIFQFNIKNYLLTKGKKFFKDINKQRFLEFIEDIEEQNDTKILNFLKEDDQFAVSFANTIKKLPELRRKIIEKLPDNKNISKDKLVLLLNYDEENYDEAFEIVRKIDLSNLSYIECIPIFKIVREKKAWDFEVIILKKLIEKEEDEKEIFNLNLELFNAYYNLEKYIEVIEIGEKLLNQDSVENFLSIRNKEVLLASTIQACFERGKVDDRYLIKSKEFIEKFNLTQPSFEFKVGIEAEVYLKNNEPQKAMESVIEGVKVKKVLTPEEYIKLYYVLSIQIANQITLNLESLDKINENTFVKLKNKDKWYFIGDDNELDAIKISKENDNYLLFIDQTIGNEIVFIDKYGSENRIEIVEYIFPIDKYILWKTVKNFNELSKYNIIEGIQHIEVPQKEGTIDTKYLLKCLEDLNRRTEPFFKEYSENKYPLAMLAFVEGGLTNAISRIQNENKGFVNFSLGSSEELNKQRSIAEKIIDKEMSFYIDGTSALFLSEIGLFKRVYTYLPNLKVPQSVISFLIDISERFSYKPGQAGYLGYAQGKITISSIDKDRSDSLRSNFLESIKLLESKPNNISIISSANKVDSFSEKKVPEELCDACILAQKENLCVLTEDFLYLKMNELETRKKSPEYFSSLVLLRILYEKGKVSFDEYLDFFGFLSSYRFRFLSLSHDDIEKAVFGDGKIKKVSPENFQKLNFQLTLSEEYGVSFKTAFTVVGRFLLKVLLDDTIFPEVMERIFIEIIESFPTKVGKYTLVLMFIEICIKSIEQMKSKLIINVTNEIIEKKIEKLLLVKEIYISERKLWIPNK